MGKSHYHTGTVFSILITLILTGSCGVNPATSNTTDTDNMIVGTWASSQPAYYTFNSDGTYVFTPWTQIGTSTPVSGTYSTTQSTGQLALSPSFGSAVTLYYSISADNNTLTIYYEGNYNENGATNYSRQ
jgi:hypothetical protein